MTKEAIVIKLLELQLEWAPVPGEGNVLLGQPTSDDYSPLNTNLQYLSFDKACSLINEVNFEIIDILPGYRPVIRIVN